MYGKVKYIKKTAEGTCSKPIFIVLGTGGFKIMVHFEKY